MTLATMCMLSTFLLTSAEIKIWGLRVHCRVLYRGKRDTVLKTVGLDNAALFVDAYLR